jgi:hypothetical protein
MTVKRTMPFLLGRQRAQSAAAQIQATVFLWKHWLCRLCLIFLASPCLQMQG